jgi:hypothetical protein
MRPLLLDGSLPAGLDAELRARGRSASAAPPDALDAALLALPVVLVTTLPLRPPPGGAAVAMVTARDAAGRRDAVHRHAHAMASQRAGTLRTYR